MIYGRHASKIGSLRASKLTLMNSFKSPFIEMNNAIGDCGCPLTCGRDVLDGKNKQEFACKEVIYFAIKTHGIDRDTACTSASEQRDSPCAGDGIACNPKKCRLKIAQSKDIVKNCGCPDCNDGILDGSNGQHYTCRSRIQLLMTTYGSSRDSACTSASEQGNSPCAGNACNPIECKQKGSEQVEIKSDTQTSLANTADEIADCGCPKSCTKGILDGANSQMFSCKRRIRHLMDKKNHDRDAACTIASEQENSPCVGDGIACNPKKCKEQVEIKSDTQTSLATYAANTADCGCPKSCTKGILDGTNSQNFSCKGRIRHMMDRYNHDRDAACTIASEQKNSPCAGDGIACNPKRC